MKNELSLNRHYSDQRGHWERGIMNKALRTLEARSSGLSRGNLTVQTPAEWIARRYPLRPTHSGKR